MEIVPGSSTSEAELEHLERFLLSEAVPEDAMTLAELDGFLTGLGVGPEDVPAEEWMPVVWGSGEPEFESEEELRRVLTTIFSRLSELRRQIETAPQDYAPIYELDEEERPDATMWAAGFVQAMDLRPEAWEPLFEDEEGFAAVMAILVTAAEGELPEGVEADRREIAEVLGSAPELMPACVLVIHRFWREREPRPTAH